MLANATPAEEPNQIIEPPKPTAYARKPQSYPPCFSASAVSGILSKTADTKPSPNAVCHEATGSFSTGIIEAHVTRESRKTLPLKASGSRLHSGLRTGVDSNSATHTAAPRKGKRSDR